MSLVIYLQSHFEKLKKNDIKLPTFITNNITTIERLTKKLSVNHLTLQIAEIRSLTDKNKLLWLYKGTWEPIFAKIDVFFSDLITYKNKLDNEAVRLRNYCEYMENKDLNKFTSTIFNIH